MPSTLCYIKTTDISPTMVVGAEFPKESVLYCGNERKGGKPFTAKSGLSDCCPVPSDDYCLKLYAVEAVHGKHLSKSSSMQHMNGSGLSSLSTQPSLHCSFTTSPAMGVVTTVSGMGSSGTGLSARPASPRLTTCVLSSQKYPFAATSPGVTRCPQATVAPMPQAQQCPPITTEAEAY
ncbi:hypothetical protein CRM22_009593 [Opisthorchis felineus]|uniref:Uncharacterized protein n=1 Tax=Opisthorchis felineus TaxID=147828 RepID=A0A4S2LDX6_OPIFE|nr:hypothetical protein CRM22_009593 [Opisthorchis felineus]